MSLGYNNKVLMVNLTTGEMHVEEPGEKLFRMYLGGTGLGTYYCMRDIPAGADPLGPENRLVLSSGVVTGAPVMAASRIIANAKSPVTGGIGDAQGGGFFAPAMKFAGFDAIVFSGIAEKPVYLFIQDGKAELRSAEHIWGMTTKDYEIKLREELGKDAVVCGIGPAGENKCAYACIINERKHAAGRTGMGCVMGSKNLKCVAAIGKKPTYEYADQPALKRFMTKANEWAKAGKTAGMTNFGTNGGISNNNNSGMLPTKNFTEGYFEPTDATLTSMVMNDTVSIGNERCYMCNIACKRHVKCTKEEHGWDVDEAYGGPEYETVASWGSYLMIDDMPTVCKANEICNAYSIDTISAGASVAFAMDLYENGLLTKEQCYGHELNFGNREGAIDLLMRIVTRDGWLGNLLADGIDHAAAVIGNGADYYIPSVKNNPYPAHMPQVKKNLAVHYAVNEHGADHMTALHDPMLAEGAFSPAGNYVLGIYDPMPYRQLTEEKMKLNYYSHILRAVFNGVCVCAFGYGPTSMYTLNDTIDMLNDITGWNTNRWEVMKAAERTLVLMRLFNEREGFGAKDDVLPKRMFEQKFSYGPAEGEYVNEDDFYRCRSVYYDMAGLDQEGHARHSKVVELDLQWAEELVRGNK